MNREITNIPADDTARALTAPDGAVLDIVHDDKLTTKFRFTNIPDTVTLVSEYAAKNIAAVLEFNTFKDVRKAAGLVFTDTSREFGTKTVFTASISPATAISFGRASPSAGDGANAGGAHAGRAIDRAECRLGLSLTGCAYPASAGHPPKRQHARQKNRRQAISPTPVGGKKAIGYRRLA